LKQVLQELRNRAEKKGYITFDEIIKISDKEDLSLVDIDSVSGLLLDEGYIILENKPAQETGKVVDDSEYDKSQIDYERIYREVLGIAPRLSTYINDVKKIPAPRAHEETELIALAKEGNEYATDRLVLMFLKIVIRHALYFHKTYGLPLEEAIQDGNIGLIKAIEKFNAKSGNRFSSYAPWWIRQVILRQTMGVCIAFQVPEYVKSDLLLLIKHFGPKTLEYYQGNLSSILSISSSKITNRISEVKLKVYLDLLEEPIPLECIAQPTESIPYNTLTPMLRKYLDKAMYILPPRDVRVLQLRYGLLGGRECTLEEISQELGVTRERIRQIEARSLGKLRHPVRSLALQDFL
jgi:RNA polymerase primary sigma factor